jgi:hypothetical protein
MRSPRSQWVFVLVFAPSFCLYDAWIAFGTAGRGDRGRELFLVVALAGFLALVPHVLAHELGHLAAGYALGLRPAAVSLGSRSGGRRRSIGKLRVYVSTGTGYAVSARPDPTGRLLELRMSLFVLAGPATNLLLAGVTYLAARAAPPEPRAVLLPVAVLGLAFGVFSLVPMRSGHGRVSDGSNLLRWMFRATRTRTLHTEAASHGEAIADLRRLAARRPAELLARLDEPRTGADLAAFVARLADLIADPQTDPDLATDLAVRAIWRLVEAFLPKLAEPEDQLHRPASGLLGVLADRVVSRQPERVDARTAAALVRIFQSRYGQARDLIGDRLVTAHSAVPGRLHAVRALLEAADGDLATGRRYLDRAEAAEPDLFLLPLLRRRLSTEPAEGPGAPAS